MMLAEVLAQSAGSDNIAFVVGSSVWSSVPQNVSFTIPPIVGRDQIYYWTRTWQEGEERALADLAAGRSRTFSDPRELARYLLRPAD